MKYKGSAQRPLLTLDKKSAVVYRKQEEVSIPEKYQIIAAEAFKGNPKMKSLEIGPGMKKIGMRAFQGCIKLTKVRMAHSVNHLSEGYESGRSRAGSPL